MSIISVENVTVKYQGQEALTNLTFNINQGDYLGVVGPNGSGKTTLLKTVLGLIQPSSGTVTIYNQPISAFKNWNKIGYVPQTGENMSNRKFPATAEEIVASGLAAKKNFIKRLNKDDKIKINETIKLLQIENIRNKQIGKLSEGQKQRALLARALVSDPEMLFLDEPTSSLDPATRESLYLLLQKLHGQKGITIVLISHDSGSIGKYATRLLYLNRQVIFCGTFEDFCRSSEMTDYFGEFSQHLICHRHDDKHFTA